MNNERGRGRPKKDLRTINRFSMWLFQDDVDILEHVSIETGLSWAGIVRKALRYWYKNWLRNPHI